MDQVIKSLIREYLIKRIKNFYGEDWFDEMMKIEGNQEQLDDFIDYFLDEIESDADRFVEEVEYELYTNDDAE